MANDAKYKLISTHAPDERNAGLSTTEAQRLATEVLALYSRTRNIAAAVAKAMALLAIGEHDRAADLCRLAQDRKGNDLPWLYDVTQLDGRGVTISFDDGHMSLSVGRTAKWDELSVAVDFGPEGSNGRARNVLREWGDMAVYILPVAEPVS